MVFLVTYDLNRPGQEYPALYDTISKIGAWWHFLDSTWLVDTTLTAGQIRDRIRMVVDPTDHFLVVQFGPTWASFLPKEANDWIQEHTRRRV